MSIADLKNVLRIFGGSDIDAGAQQELYKEVLLMVLARASSSDANIQAIEVESILTIIKNETGDEVSEQDVRRAGRTELYETTPLDKYLSSTRKKLADEDRVKIIHLLADIIKSDTTVSVLEVDFFNMVADALRISPAEIAGLTP